MLYPERFDCDVKPLSFTDYGTLTFAKPDFETFDCLSSCIEAIKRGGAYPCIVNAANEEAVGLFLKREIPFLGIGNIVRAALEHFGEMPAETYGDIISVENAARDFVKENYTKIK